MDTSGQRPPFSATNALGYGFKGFTANLLPLIVIGLALLVVSLASSFLTQGFNSYVLSVAGNVLSLFLSLLISLGLIRAALAILDGRRPTVEQLVSTQDIGPYLVASIVVAAAVTIGLILCVIPGLIIGFLLQFYGYAIVDHKVDSLQSATASDPIGAIKASYTLVTKNLGSIIVLALLCFAANLVGALLCGVGLLVSIPVTAIAVAYAWRYFSGGKIMEPASA